MIIKCKKCGHEIVSTLCIGYLKKDHTEEICSKCNSEYMISVKVEEINSFEEV